MKTILFVDLGNVVCHFNHLERLSNISKEFGFTIDALDTLFWKSGFDNKCDSGEYSLIEICDFIRLEACSSISNNDIAKLWVTAFSLNREFVNMLQRVSRFDNKILFTDNSPLIESGINSFFPEISNLFDDKLFSYKLNGTKKTYKTFEKALDLYECKAHDALIIDDNDTVLLSAQKAGMKTIKYTKNICISSVEESLFII
jgi:FMN phosphatase YigB (HAD superfamily)